jgi:FKBP-type peptidyl-prolyl cis-trans isomerase
MKIRIASLFLAGLLLSACEAPQEAADELSLDTDAQKHHYALGMDIGNSLKQQLPVDVQTDYVAAGLRDALAGEARLSQEEFQTAMQDFVSELEGAEREKATAEAEANRLTGEKFLAENKSQQDVQVTDSGLQYKVLEKTDGPSPDAGDSVKVHYEGRLLDGAVFDSSRERGEPVTFPVEGVIPGWTEALQLMPEGSRYRLFIPPELAYGERGAGDKIGPNQTLVFDVELLEVIEGS